MSIVYLFSSLLTLEKVMKVKIIILDDLQNRSQTDYSIPAERQLNKLEMIKTLNKYTNAENDHNSVTTQTPCFLLKTGKLKIDIMVTPAELRISPWAKSYVARLPASLKGPVQVSPPLSLSSNNWQSQCSHWLTTAVPLSLHRWMDGQGNQQGR